MSHVGVPSTFVLSFRIQTWKGRNGISPTRFWVSFVLALAITGYRNAQAQQITRFEFGVGGYGQTATQNPGTPGAFENGYVGPFARFSVNLNRSIALEASGFDSVNLAQSDDVGKSGGHQALFLAGVKAGIRRRFFGIYGRIDAGAASYSRGVELVQVLNGRVVGPPLYYRKTHFALEPGASVEFYPTQRFILRADVDENLNAAFSTINVINPYAYQVLGGVVPHHLGIGISLERRFGPLENSPAASTNSERFSVGGYFALQIREQHLIPNAPALGGGGAWLEIPGRGLLSFDLTAFDLPHDDHTAGAQDGGTPFAAFAGPKVGFHSNRFGIFVKARPGVTRFSRTQSSLTVSDSGQFTAVYHPQYQFSLDTGAVFEYTPVKHALLRLEAGDDLIYYHTHNTAYNYPGDAGVAIAPATHSSSILFLTGLGWRF